MITIPAPPGKAYLPYQEKGIRYMLGGTGTILADEMGLGKTVQAIGTLNALQALNVLIVCPAGLKLNWQNELAEWLVPLPRGQAVHVASYHEAKIYVEHPEWDLLIVDEAHYIKNPQAQRSQTIKALAKRAKRTILLTGTPIENRPIELWPLLQIACPEKWDPPNPLPVKVMAPESRKTHPGEGPNFWEFARLYCDLKRSYFPARGRQQSAWDFSGASNLDELRAKLRETCMVRRLKKDVLTELPEKTHQVIVLPSKGIDDSALFPEMTEENYDRIIRKLTADKAEFAEFSRKRHEQALAMLDEFIKFIEDQLDSSGKIVIFAHHTDVIEGLAEALDPHNPVTIMGSTPMAERDGAVRRFQEDKGCRVFIGAIGAAGVGITLTAASHVIFVELDPVPGRMAQAADRVHRIGQREAVLIQYLVANRSLSARMAKILVKKQKVIGQALDGVGA